MRAMKASPAGYAALATTSIVWGTTWVASKMGTQYMHPLQLAWMRQLLGGVLILAYFFLVQKEPLPTRRQFGWLVLMSVLMFVIANGFSTWAVQYISSGFAALISALYPLSVMLLQFFFFGQKNLSRFSLVGLLLGVGGVALVFYENTFHSSQKILLPGLLLSLSAMLSWSLGSIYLARNKTDINPYYGVGWQMLLSAIILFVFSQGASINTPFAEISRPAWLIVLYLCFVGTILGYIAFTLSLRVLPVTIASLYAYINPLVAIAIGSWLISEPLTVYIVAGSLITLAGVFIVNMGLRRAKR